ncbi:MAG: LysR substrate-binding domain-containing protein [Komagataeibacter saccharivorans]|uniref:LysR substrate-binding domain-containing protein n=1 Tax=Komagataeibacter saccharivorans TaxID=265959 RepID=UPI0039E92221
MDEHLTSVSLRRLAVFLTVCETLHVARAAEKLDIAQPALSQQIKALEEALGAQLFHRRKRGIDLTSAGHACREAAQHLLKSHHNLIDGVRSIARGEMGQLVLGHVGSALAGRIFPNHLQRMKQHFPEVQITLAEKSISDLVTAVTKKDIDVALVRDLETVPSICSTRRYITEKLFVLLPENHPLASRTDLSIRAIHATPLIGFQDPDEVGIARIVQQIAEKNGLSLEPSWKVTNIGSIFGMVHAGFGLSIVAESVTALLPAGLSALPLSEPDAESTLFLLWNREQISPALQKFIELS